MGFRTVIIKNRAKLEYRLNALVVRGETEKKIYLNEINTLIIQSTAVALTASLLNELIKENIKVIFCDEKCNPSSELVACYGAYDTAKKYPEQFLWDDKTKAIVWQEIIRKKIDGQAELLSDMGFEVQAQALCEYAREVEEADITNREGHAAKVYFNCILGGTNSRRNGSFLNGCLNYGYAILVSAFNREIVASGYLTQLGIWHKNNANNFNLSCDLMEPFRVVVDRTALSIDDGDTEFKKKLINILNFKTEIDGQTTTLDLAIRRFTKSVFHAMEEQDVQLLVFPDKITVENEL